MKIIPCIKPANKAAVLLITLASLCLCSGCGRKKIDTGQWYDYGNGLINLNNVTHIELLDVSMIDSSYRDGINQEYIDITLEEWSDGKKRNFNPIIFFDSFQLSLEGGKLDKDEWEDKVQEALETYENLVERLNAIKHQ